MHKNIGVILLAVIILATLLFGSIVFVKAENVTAATSTTGAVQVAEPTILPGSPFYFFKRLGEGFVNLLTFGKVNQAKRALELSQVRLAEGQALLEKDKASLAQKSIEEYQTMLGEASQFAQKAREGGKNVDGMLAQISQTTLKNQQVLLSVIEKAPEQAKPGLQNAIKASAGERQQALQGLSEQKRWEIEAQDFIRSEAVQNKIEDLKLEGVISSKKITLSGKLVAGGVECQRFESSSGDFYTLIGFNNNQFKNGDRILIKGEIQEVSYCMQDATVKVNEIKKLDGESVCKESSDCGKPLVCPNEKEYPAWSCDNGVCNQIMYFRDPCSPVPSSRPFIKEILPSRGTIGSQVTIYGSGFSATKNTVMFSYGAIPDIESKNGTNITFKIPEYLDPLCYFQKFPCLMASKEVVPGKYEVLVKNDNGTSNSVTFEVVGSEPHPSSSIVPPIPSIIPPIECRIAADCGKPLVCKDGKEYPAWSCNEGKCNQILYARYPCESLPLPSPISVEKELIKN